MSVKLINQQGKLVLPMPGNIDPKYEQYSVFQTKEGVILCIPFEELITKP